jgi:hypothetical protein
MKNKPYQEVHIYSMKAKKVHQNLVRLSLYNISVLHYRIIMLQMRLNVVVGIQRIDQTKQTCHVPVFVCLLIDVFEIPMPLFSLIYS